MTTTTTTTAYHMNRAVIIIGRLIKVFSGVGICKMYVIAGSITLGTPVGARSPDTQAGSITAGTPLAAPDKRPYDYYKRRSPAAPYYAPPRPADPAYCSVIHQHRYNETTTFKNYINKHIDKIDSVYS